MNFKKIADTSFKDYFLIFDLSNKILFFFLKKSNINAIGIDIDISGIKSCFYWLKEVNLSWNFLENAHKKSTCPGDGLQFQFGLSWISDIIVPESPGLPLNLGFKMFWSPCLCLSESGIKIKINFYVILLPKFLFSQLWCLERFYEGF